MVTISVVIPLFNKAAYVQAALEVFVSQLAAGDEVVVVDDLSTDDGPARIERLATGLPGGALRLVCQRTNGGPATARNAGAREARGQYLLFFDADDLPHPQLLAFLRRCIARHPSEAVFAYDLAVQAHGESTELVSTQSLERVATQVLPLGAFVRSSLRGKPLCTASSTCVRAPEFLAAGGFQSGLRYCEDPELWARLSARHPIVHIAATLAVYRDVPASLSYGLRSQPGSVQPYVATLLSLSLRPGDDYQRLARSFITRNIVFSLTMGAPHVTVVDYLNAVRSYVAAPHFFALRLLVLAPPALLRLPFRLRAWRATRRSPVT